MPTSPRSRGLATSLLPATAGLRVEHISTSDQPIELTLVTTTPTASCPTCTAVASRVHSRYTRMFADLPWGGTAVRIALQVRRFFCTTAACQQRLFAERVPSVVAPYARRTNRLHELVRLLGFALGGEAGSRMANRLRMTASPSTLLRLIRQAPEPPLPTPRALGVDDFARRKGHTYGTLLVDLDKHRPIELLPDRTAETLSAWLKAHPGVEVISRDRSTEYTRGATEGAPHALQVADRFHLLVNLREALERLVDRNRSHVRGLVLPQTAALVLPVSAQRQPVRRSPGEEAARQARVSARQERHSEIQALSSQGLEIRSIARRLHLSRGTVYRYLRLDEQSAGLRTHSVRSKLDPYLPYLYHRWQAGCHNGLQLWRELTEKGYQGSRKMVATWVRQQRQEPAPTTPRKYLAHSVIQPDSRTAASGAPHPGSGARTSSSRQLAWFLLRDATTLSLAEQAALTEMQQRCKDVAAAYPLIHEFLRMLRERDGAAYAAWRAAVLEHELPELTNYVGGLDRDQGAVLAALSLEWSNGQTEGQVNRLKTLKRQMYGRANFDLLRKRVLHAA